MIIAMHQPAFLPWLGYLDKIKRADVFVYMDSILFSRSKVHFINRNRIKTAQGPLFLTVPVKSKSDTLIKYVMIDLDRAWKTKHLKAISDNYASSPGFKMFYPVIQEMYERNYEYLTDLCWDQLQHWLKLFKIKTKIIKLSDLKITSNKSQLLLDICKELKATVYLSGSYGKAYLDENLFEKNEIKIEYQCFEHPIYPQRYGEFVPALSALDFCMNAPELVG